MRNLYNLLLINLVSRFNFILNLVAIILIVFVPATMFGEEKNGPELKDAFSALAAAMADDEEQALPEVDTNLDQALEDTFSKITDPVPPLIEHSTVKLEDVTPSNSKKAVDYLANTDVDNFDSHDYRQQGMALSFSLWSGGQKKLKRLLSEIIRDGYIDGDSLNVRFELTSNPIPEITAREDDLNREIREHQQKLKESPGVFSMPILKSTPEKPGVIIRISAGMLAAVDNVDQLAGQIYKPLAKLNHSVYGVTENKKFLQNQEIILLLNEIAEDGDSESSEEFVKQRDIVVAEMSVMERMVDAGFNPWELYNFEHEVYSVLTDVFMKSKNHSFARWALSKHTSFLKDWARPVRKSIMFLYMGYLQDNNRQGRPLNLKSRKFSANMKYMRLRMKLFTKPFFMGLGYQLPLLTIAGATVATTGIAPEIFHWALQAINHTTSEFATYIGIDTLMSKAGTQLGELLSTPIEITNSILNSRYFDPNMLDPVKEFFLNYKTVLTVGGASIATAFMAKYGVAIGAAFRGAARDLDESNQIDIDISESIEIVKEEKPDFKSKESKSNQPNKTIRSQVQTESDFGQPWSEVIGERLANFWRKYQERRTVYISGSKERRDRRNEKGHLFLAATKRGLTVIGMGAQRRVGNLAGHIYNVASASKNLSIALGHGTVNKSISAWDGIISFGKKAPRRLGKAGVYTAKKAVSTVSFGKRVGMSTLAILGVGTAFVTIYTPYKLTTGGIKTLAWAAEGSVATAKNVLRRAKEELEIRQEEKKEHLASVKELDDFLAGEGVSLFEINQVLDNVLEVLHYKKGKSHYGLSAHNGKTLQVRIFQIFEKWLKVASSTRKVDGADVMRILSSMENTYPWLSYKLRKNPEFIGYGKKIITLAVGRNSTWRVKKLVKKYNEKSLGNFTKDMTALINVEKLKSRKFGKSSLNDISGKSAFEQLVKWIDYSGDVRENATLVFRNRGKDLLMVRADDLLKYLSGPEASIKQINVFRELLAHIAYNDKNILNFRAASRLRNIAKRMEDAVFKLSDIEMVKLYKGFGGGDNLNRSNAFTRKVKKILKNSNNLVADKWVARANSIGELVNFVKADTDSIKLDANLFQRSLHKAVLSKMELFSSFDDIQKFYDHEFFWPVSLSEGMTTPIERPLSILLEEKRKMFPDSSAWKYDPVFTERVQYKLIKVIKKQGVMPAEDDFNGLYKLWDMFSSRGVSTVTDGLLNSLVQLASPKQLDSLEEYAVRQGRVLDQKIQNKFAIRQIKKSPEYIRLIERAEEIGTDKRMPLIRDVVEVAQKTMGELGIAYANFLEELAVDIHVSIEESKMIHEYKVKSVIANVESATKAGSSDQRLKVFKEILPYVKTWSSKKQSEFILYIRGSIEATPFIKSQFPENGPERIRGMFQGLPINSAIGVMDMYLRETLLSGKKEVTKGPARKLMKRLISEGAKGSALPEGATEDERFAHIEKLKAAKEDMVYADQVLQALLTALASEAVGNKPFQLTVLSAMAAMKPDESSSVGETLRVVLERFPGIGPKIAQFLVPTKILGDEINKVLSKTQDDSRPVLVHEMYEDLQGMIGENKIIPFVIYQPEGSGSMKYTFSAIEPITKMELILQVFRLDVQNNSELYIRILQETVKELIRKNGIKWAFLEVVVDGAINAVRREKNFNGELRKTLIARKRLYTQFNDDMFDVEVPEQHSARGRYLSSRKAKGVSFKELSLKDKQIVGLKLLSMEADILFNDKHIIWFDPDRHAGNYLIYVRHLIELNQGRKPYEISPIDFGQLTSITSKQRDKLVKLFAYASIAKTGGGDNSWLVNQVADLFGIDQADRGKLAKNMKEFFPTPFSSKNESTIITSYFSLIASVNLAVKGSKVAYSGDLEKRKLDFAYTDFVRGIIQLNQYESEVFVPEGARTPSKVLDSLVKDFLAEQLPEIELSKKQEMKIFIKNGINRVKAFAGSGEYEPINIKMSREELDKFTLFDAGKDKETLKKLKAAGMARSAIPEFNNRGNLSSQRPGGACVQAVQ